MNRVLNLSVGKLVRALMAGRAGRLPLAVLVLGAGGFSALALGPDVVAGPAQGASAQYELAGRVVRVSDGDTFNVLVQGRQQRVRMASIDAPEVTKDKERPGQPYAQASRDALASLISGKDLVLVCYERDRYERNICDVPLADGMTANQKQVENGMAWANMEGRGKFMRDARLPSLEQQARRAGRGIWRQPEPVPPWVWRYQCWQQQQC